IAPISMCHGKNRAVAGINLDFSLRVFNVTRKSMRDQALDGWIFQSNGEYPGHQLDPTEDSDIGNKICHEKVLQGLINSLATARLASVHLPRFPKPYRERLLLLKLVLAVSLPLVPGTHPKYPRSHWETEHQLREFDA